MPASPGDASPFDGTVTQIHGLEAIMGPVASNEMRVLVEADAENTQQLQGVLHSKLLGQIVHGFSSAPADKRQRNAALTQFARLHALIARDVPIVEHRVQCATIDPQETVRERLGSFIAFEWPSDLAPQMEVLLRAYHRHGYLDLGDMEIPNTAGFNPASYLEVAMMGSNSLGITALLELGAAKECVPAKDFAFGSGDERVSVAAGDFNAFVELMYGPLPHPVHGAIEEGVRRRMAIDMTSVISSQAPWISAAKSNPRRPRAGL